MGIIRHGDALKPKKPTAFIEGFGTVTAVRIKHKIGSIFLARIDGQILPFSLKNAEMFIYRPGHRKASIAYFFSVDNVTGIQSWESSLQQLRTGSPLNTVSLNLLTVAASLETDDTDVYRRDMEEILKHLNAEYDAMEKTAEGGDEADSNMQYDMMLTARTIQLCERCPADVMPFSCRRVLANLKETLTEATPNVQHTITDAVSRSSLKKALPPERRVNAPLSSTVDWVKVAFVLTVAGIIFWYMTFGGVASWLVLQMVPPPPPPPPPPPLSCEPQDMAARYANHTNPTMASAVAYITKHDTCPPPPDLQDLWVGIEGRELRYELLKTGDIATNSVDHVMAEFWAEMEAGSYDEP